MPTYEYRCKDCGHDLEAVQSFTDDALTECPACAGRLRKVFGNVGIAFKGSGFYKTDSRSGAPEKAGSNGETKSDKAGDTAGSKSEGKGGKGEGSKDKGSKDAKASSGSSSGDKAKSSTTSSS